MAGGARRIENDFGVHRDGNGRGGNLIYFEDVDEVQGRAILRRHLQGELYRRCRWLGAVDRYEERLEHARDFG